MQRAALSLERLRREVVEGLAYVDNYLELLPDFPELTEKKRCRQEITALYDQAETAARTARQPHDFGRVEELMEQASHDIVGLKQFIDRRHRLSFSDEL